MAFFSVALFCFCFLLLVSPFFLFPLLSVSVVGKKIMSRVIPVNIRRSRNEIEADFFVVLFSRGIYISNLLALGNDPYA